MAPPKALDQRSDPHIVPPIFISPFSFARPAEAASWTGLSGGAHLCGYRADAPAGATPGFLAPLLPDLSSLLGRKRPSAALEAPGGLTLAGDDVPPAPKRPRTSQHCAGGGLLVRPLPLRPPAEHSQTAMRQVGEVRETGELDADDGGEYGGGMEEPEETSRAGGCGKEGSQLRNEAAGEPAKEGRIGFKVMPKSSKGEVVEEADEALNELEDILRSFSRPPTPHPSATNHILSTPSSGTATPTSDDPNEPQVPAFDPAWRPQPVENAWQPWSFDYSVIDNDLGLDISVPVGPIPGRSVVGELAEEERTQLHMRIQQRNQELLGRYHALPAPSRTAAKYLDSTSAALPLSIFEDDSLAIQPPKPTPLNNRVASGQLTKLGFYIYGISAWLRSGKDLVAWVCWLTRLRRRARKRGWGEYLHQFISGLVRLAREGGMNGLLKRALEYIGLSHGVHGQKNSPKMYFRTLDHLLSSSAPTQFVHLIIQAAASFVRVTKIEMKFSVSLFATSDDAKPTPPKHAEQAMESIFAAWRLSTPFWGGTNLAPCSGGDFPLAVHEAMSRLPDTATLDETLSLNEHGLPSALPVEEYSSATLLGIRQAVVSHGSIAAAKAKPPARKAQREQVEEREESSDEETDLEEEIEVGGGKANGEEEEEESTPAEAKTGRERRGARPARRRIPQPIPPSLAEADRILANLPSHIQNALRPFRRDPAYPRFAKLAAGQKRWTKDGKLFGFATNSVLTSPAGVEVDLREKNPDSQPGHFKCIVNVGHGEHATTGRWTFSSTDPPGLARLHLLPGEGRVVVKRNGRTLRPAAREQGKGKKGLEWSVREFVAALMREPLNINAGETKKAAQARTDALEKETRRIVKGAFGL